MYYPPVGFYFVVEVLGLQGQDDDLRFSEVSGLSMELKTEELVEGGQNRFTQKLPTRASYPELVLKRGMLVGSGLTEWARSCIEELNITPRNVDVTLLNEAGDPLMTWHLVNAYPTKWSVSSLNATNNALVVETLQLYYQYFTLAAG
ncbi:MAG: phage tail protein [Alphaproteobacteria bacterium]|nr:phage tail protein [Alphaproteobacteria bacterium]